MAAAFGMAASTSTLVSYDGLRRSAPEAATALRLPAARLQAQRPLQVVAKQDDPKTKAKKRHLRVRKKVTGTEERPRLSVYRSNNHIFAQVIDDTRGVTIAAAGTLQADIKGELGQTGNVTAAAAVGEKLAKLCLEKGVSKVSFDRGGFLYHGRVKAVADAARSGGLVF
eukprot:jgi/Chlat1/2142/Chrsp17S02721